MGDWTLAAPRWAGGSPRYYRDRGLPADTAKARPRTAVNSQLRYQPAFSVSSKNRTTKAVARSQQEKSFVGPFSCAGTPNQRPARKIKQLASCHTLMRHAIFRIGVRATFRVATARTSFSGISGSRRSCFQRALFPLELLTSRARSLNSNSIRLHSPQRIPLSRLSA